MRELLWSEARSVTFILVQSCFSSISISAGRHQQHRQDWGGMEEFAWRERGWNSFCRCVVGSRRASARVLVSKYLVNQQRKCTFFWQIMFFFFKKEPQIQHYFDKSKINSAIDSKQWHCYCVLPLWVYGENRHLNIEIALALARKQWNIQMMPNKSFAMAC